MSSNFRHIVHGINLVPNATTQVSEPGDMDYSTDTGKFNFFGSTGSASAVVTESGTQTLTNKTINASNNTLSNISNTSIATNAAISFSKLANLPSAQILVGSAGNVATAVAVSGDATLSNSGALTVVTVGGSTASNINSATILANASTSANTASATVRRDASGNFSAGTITATLSGNASTATSATTATTAGNVTGIVAVANGGTGRSTLTANNVLLGNGTSSVSFVAPGTSGNVLTSNGTTWVSSAGAGGGASTTLNNLGVTSVNADLLPASSAINIGSFSNPWGTIASNTIIGKTNGKFGDQTVGHTQVQGFTPGPSGISAFGSISSFNGITTSGVPFLVYTQNNADVDSSATGKVAIESGNKTAGTGNSGDISLRIGTSSGGTRGKIQFQDGSEGVAGRVWTSTDGTGKGAWVAPAGLNYTISSSSGSFSSSSTSYVDITNLSVSITTTGRPVLISVISDGTANFSRWNNLNSSNFSVVRLLRDATEIADAECSGGTANTPPQAFSHFDVPAAGTYAYKLQLKVNSAGTSSFANAKLVAREL